MGILGEEGRLKCKRERRWELLKGIDGEKQLEVDGN
jgi:hypothetical protein